MANKTNKTKQIKNLLPILYVRYTLLTLELSLATKTSHGHHTLFARHALNICEYGQMGR